MKARRDYRAEYRRRRRQARERGFRSVREMAAAKRPTSVQGFADLPDGARAARRAALQVVAFARLSEMPAEVAADELGVPIAAVHYWADEALGPTRNGKTMVKKADRLVRLRPLFLEGGHELEFVAIRGSNKAYDAVWVFDIQWRFVNGQADESELEQIRDVAFAGRTVESDPVELARVAAAGGFDPDDIYNALVA